MFLAKIKGFVILNGPEEEFINNEIENFYGSYCVIDRVLKI